MKNILYDLDNDEKVWYLLLFAIVVLTLIHTFITLVFLLNTESDAKKCKSIRIENLQTSETIELYGTNVYSNRYGTEIHYTDKNGKEYQLILSDQDPLSVNIQVADENFCNHDK